MCGIIGGLQRDGRGIERLGLDMLEQVRYRGPDAGYLHLDPPCMLGLRRLAIINVAQGRQPVVSADGSVLAVFNGEIYNHVDLRRQLTQDGYNVREGSDAEVIPHAYLKWGLDFPRHFNGDFAIAVYDKRRQQLVLVRDRLGIKPLYYTRVAGGLLFASEVKSLFVHPWVSRELDSAFLSQLFTFWTGLDGMSPFAGIHQVEAGTVLVVDDTGQEIGRRKYWDIPYHDTVLPFKGTFDECQQVFRAEFRKSVALRLQADVEVGTYTSGGIDSSAVNVAVYQDSAHAARQTFSVAFDDSAFDESPYQQLLVEQLHLESHQVRCNAQSIYENLLHVIRHTESPIFRTAPVPMYLLSQRVARQGIKVVLTGEGADEVAWGYDIFREAKIRRFWSRQPESRSRPLLFSKLYAYLPQFQDKRHLHLLVDFFKQELQQTSSPLYSHHTRIANSRAANLFLSSRLKAFIEQQSPTQALMDSLPSDFGRRTLLEKCQYLEMRTLLQGYLLSSQGDRMLSAHGVEGRFPYLDHHLIEFLAGVPERYRLRGLYDKAILRETFRRDLPPCITERPKFAFRAPEMYAFANDPEGIVDHYLHDRNLDDAGIFDAAAVRRLRYRLTHGTPGQFSTRENLAFVQILTTQMLHELFVQQFSMARGDHHDITITYGYDAGDKQAAA